MNRFWRIAVVLAALCVALAAMAACASAAKPHGGGAPKQKPAAGVDKSFGVGGVAKIATGGSQGPAQMALGSNGRVYVLQAPLLLAFEADGKPARGFGNNGRVRIEGASGYLGVSGLTVDSEGRILVVGTTNTPAGAREQATNPSATEPWNSALPPIDEATVVRFDEDGKRDPSFGNAGEVDTTFGLPRPTGALGAGIEYPAPVVIGTTISVDRQDRPVVGGNFYTAAYACGAADDISAPYTARLTASGAVDTSYAGGKGYSIVGPNGSVQALTETPEGGVATLSAGRPCGPREDPEASTFVSLTEEGLPSPTLDPARPTMYTTMIYTTPMFAVDSKGRFLFGQIDGPYPGGTVTLSRLLPSGAFDTSFGSNGGVPLLKGVTDPGAIAVDAKDRTVVAQSEMGRPYGPRVVRYTAAGKRDWKFGRKGLLEGPVANDEKGTITSMAIDGKGRIYTAGYVESKSLKTGHGIQITRFLPGK
jgi:hypothetical protein